MNGHTAFTPPILPAGLIEQIDWPPVPTPHAAALLAMQFQLEQSQWLPAEELERRQLTQVGRVLQHAFDSVPHYREKYRAWPAGSLDWNRWRELPLLERAEIQDCATALRSTQIPADHGALRHYGSSGSTGRPLRVLGNETTHFYWLALGLRDHVWHRQNLALKHAVIRSKVERGAADGWGEWSDSLMSGPAVSLNIRTDPAEQLDWLRTEAPHYLLTYPSNLEALLDEAARSGITLPSLQQVRCFGERLRPGLHDRVAAQWGIPLTDLYSAEETGIIALQCPQHRHYHVMAENLLVEVLHPDGTPCQPGETGEVVLTTLHNFAMPLIRYRLLDHAEVGPPCPCGRGLPVLTHIVGRSRNRLVLPDGRSYWPTFPGSAWLDIPAVRQFQIEQLTPERIEVRLVCVRPLDPGEEAAVRQLVCTQLGHPFTVELRCVDQIEAGPNHKTELFTSRVARPESPA